MGSPAAPEYVGTLADSEQTVAMGVTGTALAVDAAKTGEVGVTVASRARTTAVESRPARRNIEPPSIHDIETGTCLRIPARGRNRPKPTDGANPVIVQ